MDAHRPPATAIDIGEVRLGPGTETGQARVGDRPPLRQQWQTWVGGWQVRLAVSVAAVVTALAAGGAAPPESGLLRLVSVEAIAHEIDETRLYVLRQADGEDESARTVTAYWLTDGTVAWHTDDAPHRLDGLMLHPADTLRLMPPRSPSFTMDRSTGERVDGSDIPPPSSTVSPDRLTGAVSSTSWCCNGYRLEYGAGVLTVRDQATGRELTRHQTRTEDWQLMPGGAIGITPDGEQTRVGAYTLPALEPRWDVTVRPPATVSACGSRLLCIGQRDTVSAHRPATGATVWRAGWLPDGGHYQSRPTIDGYTRVTAGRSSPDREVRRSWLVAQDTGERVLRLDGWGPIRPADDMLLTSTYAHADDSERWLGRVRDDFSGVDPLGMLPTPDDTRCSLDGRYVICEDRDPQADTWNQPLQMWRVVG